MILNHEEDQAKANKGWVRKEGEVGGDIFVYMYLRPRPILDLFLVNIFIP